MSQHDFEIANQGFPSFRSDLNSGLQALASNSAGATAPSTTYAYQMWYDSTTNLLKMRNADDDAWITLAYFDQTNDEWEVRSAVIQAVDSAGVVIKTDDGTTRLTIADDGSITTQGDLTVGGDLDVSSGTIKLDGNYPVGNNNVALGDQALDTLTTAASNTAIGYLALTSSNADNNTAVGAFAGDVISSGQNNTTVGASSMGQTTTGSDNTAIGHAALNANTTASNNTAVGKSALAANTTGVQNTATGYNSATTQTTANNSTAYGHRTLEDNTGDNNTALGSAAMQENTSGANNTAVGFNSLLSNTTGTQNVAVGTYALDANTSASYNTAVGHHSLTGNTTASYQTSIGYQAGYSSTTNSYCTHVGALAGYTSTGQLNTFIGQQAGYSMTTGEKNTILGRYNGNQGGLDIRTSSNNIVLSDGDGNPRLNFRSDAKGRFGDQPSYDLNQSLSGLGNVMMGQFGGTFGDNPIITNVGGYTSQYDHWKLYNGNGLVGRVYTDGSSTTYSTSSDYRLKENVVNIDGAIDRVKQLNPSRYNFIADPNVTLDGFLAHEVQEIVPEAVCGEKDAVDENGNIVPQGIDQSKLVPLLTAALKEAVERIETLEAKVTALETN